MYSLRYFIVLLSGISLLAISIYKLVTINGSLSQYLSATATVIDLERVGTYNDMLCPIYRYRDCYNKIKIFRDCKTMTKPSHAEIGDEVILLYKANSQDTPLVDTYWGLYGRWAVLLSIGVFLMINCFIYIVFVKHVTNIAELD